MCHIFVLISGPPIECLRRSRRLRQGSPLSLFLFLLVIEGLDRIIWRSKQDRKFFGIKVSSVHFITHLLFVDDVLIFGNGTGKDRSTYNDITKLFYNFLGI